MANICRPVFPPVARRFARPAAVAGAFFGIFAAAWLGLACGCRDDRSGDTWQRYEAVPGRSPGAAGGTAGAGGAAEGRDPDREMREILARIEEQKRRLAGGTDGRSAQGIEHGDAKRDLKAEMVLKAMRSGGMSTIRGRVYEAISGRTVPACVRATDSGDRLVGSEMPGRGFWTDGIFEARVIPGIVRFSVRPGRFVMPTEFSLEAPAGRTRRTEIAVGRPRFRLERDGGRWYAADLRAGTCSGSSEAGVFEGRCDLEALCRIARGQGIEILGVSGPYDWAARRDPAAAGRRCRELSRDGLLAIPCPSIGSHPIYGWAFAFGAGDMEGMPPPAVSSLTPPATLFEEARARGGLVVRVRIGGDTAAEAGAVLPSLPRTLRDFCNGAGALRVGMASSLPLETVLGPVYDAIELDGSEDAEELWFRILDLGYRVPALAASGARLSMGEPPEIRSLIYMEGSPSPGKVMDAVSRGRLCVTFGPALMVRIPERGLFPGDSTRADGSPCRLVIEAYASAEKGVQLDRIEIIRNGKVIFSQAADEGMTEIREMVFPLRERSHAWYVVRAFERGGNPLERRASLSNPIWFEAPGSPRPAPPRTAVSGTMADAADGKALDGRVLIVAPGEPTRECDVVRGRFEFSCPAPAALIFEAEGYEPEIAYPYAHRKILERIREYIVNPSRRPLAPMASASAFETMRLLLAEQKLEIRLRKEDARQGAKEPHQGGSGTPER
ncbi:MAG: CehA/McbA family metallohydrolase [Planctomycetota bacterium]|nr:CehA/McbA family metallohydrolase [Planctomycetota bacterium]